MNKDGMKNKNQIGHNRSDIKVLKIPIMLVQEIKYFMICFGKRILTYLIFLIQFELVREQFYHFFLHNNSNALL